MHSFPPEIGGIEAHVYNISRELVKAGHEVTVVTTKKTLGQTEKYMDGIKVVRFWSLPTPWFSSVRIVPFFIPRLFFIDADIYHSHGYGSIHPLCTAIVSFLKRKPFIFTLHGYPKLKGLPGLLKSIYSQTAARLFLLLSRKVITVTEATIPDIEKEVSASKISTIPNGVDIDRFKAKTKISKTESNDIVYIGRFDPYKGIDTLIQSFAQVKKKVKNARLLIVGHDEGVRNDLQALADKLSAEVKFSEAGQNEMPDIYRNATVVVLPSKYEGLSLVLLEAISSERPMLSTPVGAAPELFNKVYGKNSKKLLFDIGDYNQLTKKLLYIMENKKEFDSICSNARENLKETYSWKSAAEKTLELYKEVLR